MAPSTGDFPLALEANVDRPKKSKRKTTDTNLKVLTIDKQYDLTLIVGTPEHPTGQKSFQVCKSTLGHASGVWNAMLSGNWVESTMSEITFPDDSCFAFGIVLDIAHWNLVKLPKKLTKKELLDIATLSDKYDLRYLLSAAANSKNWLQSHKDANGMWPANVHLWDYVPIADAFRCETDYAYLTNKLALEMSLERRTKYCLNSAFHRRKLVIRPNFSTHILAQAANLREKILREFLQICKITLDRVMDEPFGVSDSDKFRLVKFGAIVKAFHHAQFYPFPENGSTMHDSVQSYWLLLKVIGRALEIGLPVESSNQIHTTDKSCTKDYYTKNKAREVLKLYAHKDVWAQWELVRKPVRL